MIRRLLAWLDARASRPIDRIFRAAGVTPEKRDGIALSLATRPRVTSSLAPVLAPYFDTNPRLAHCRHCRDQWAPAECPVTHDLPCPDCEDGAA